MIAAQIPANVRVQVGKASATSLLTNPNPAIGVHYHDGESEDKRRTKIDRIAPVELSKINARDFDDKVLHKRSL